MVPVPVLLSPAGALALLSPFGPAALVISSSSGSELAMLVCWTSRLLCLGVAGRDLVLGNAEASGSEGLSSVGALRSTLAAELSVPPSETMCC